MVTSIPWLFWNFALRYELLQNAPFPITITEWNKFDSDIKNIDSHAVFRKKLLIFIRSLENDTYEIYDPLVVTFLNKLRFGFNHLRAISLDKTSVILWICYVHALLKLNIQNIAFYAAKMTYHFAQPLWMI